MSIIIAEHHLAGEIHLVGEFGCNLAEKKHPVHQRDIAVEIISEYKSVQIIALGQERILNTCMINGLDSLSLIIQILLRYSRSPNGDYISVLQ